MKNITKNNFYKNWMFKNLVKKSKKLPKNAKSLHFSKKGGSGNPCATRGLTFLTNRKKKCNAGIPWESKARGNFLHSYIFF